MLRALHLSNIHISSRNVHSKLMSIQQPRFKSYQCSTFAHRRIRASYFEYCRNRSTNISTLYFDNETKKKRIKKKLYAELLEVSTNSASERRTTVKKLNAQNISELDGGTLFASTLPQEPLPLLEVIGKTNEIMLREELMNEVNSNENEIEEMMEEVEGTAEEFRELTEEVSLEESEIKDHLDGPLSSVANMATNQKIKLSKKMREELSKVQYTELERAGKEKTLANLLTAYIEVCVSCGFLNRAWFTLNYYLEYNNIKIKEVGVFDSLLAGFAKQGNFDKMKDLWQAMINNKVIPSPLSFVYRIESIARSSKHDKQELLKDTIKDMFNEGISLNKLFVGTKWKGDSREVVLKAVRVARPNFFPVLPKPDLYYSNTLVNHLNKVKNPNLSNPAEGLICKEDLKVLFNEQLKREMELYVHVRSIEEPRLGDEVNIHREKIFKLQCKWEKIVLNGFQREVNSLNALQRKVRKTYSRVNIFPYLNVLDKKEYKDIIMNEIRKLALGSDSFSPHISLLYKELGNQVKTRYENKLKFEEGLLKKLRGVYFEYGRWYLGPKTDDCVNGRQKWKMIVHKYTKGPSLEFESISWPSHLLISIGRFLYDIILKEVKIDVNILRKNATEERLLPAFYTIHKYKGSSTKEEIKPHPVLGRLFRGACLPHLTFNVAEVPMVVPPIPWNSVNSGGYIIAKSNLLRLPNQAALQWERLINSPTSQIYPCLDSLNQLGSIPWKINQPILDLLIKIFNDGGNSKLAIPEPPSSCTLPEPDTSYYTKEEKYQAYKNRLIIRRKRADMYSLWCDALYKLSLANYFRDKIFWLPHNMDFRGRVYPCPPHLNHLSSDMSRSLLCFGRGEPLGPDGLDWLKIHAINLTGLKKRNSVAERLDYANSILTLIIDSADKPLSGMKWWMESDEPWQTLATCFEIRNALQHSEGPEKFICHFPIHQDGSCNGLQHYAALGRDSTGANSVNLAALDQPQDVYSCVAALVEKERINDALAGLEIAQVIEGFVKRKVIKQTVMTTVYGVTRFGARLQIAKQLKDIEGFPQKYVWPASTYLVAKTFESLREMFSSAREIQDWLTESARLISHVCGENVEYVTPLGLPVVQPYSRLSKGVVRKGRLSEMNVPIHYTLDMFERPNVMKQRNAFPPNFIHSLDSTHMMLTSLHCEQAGITFVSVHDCFWTHPSTVHIMNKICREQFVSLHSQPILNDLSEFMVKKFGYEKSENDSLKNNSVHLAQIALNEFLMNVPSKGDFNLSNVLNSVYFFS